MNTTHTHSLPLPLPLSPNPSLSQKHLRAKDGLIFSVCNKEDIRLPWIGRRNLPLPISTKSCQDREQRLKCFSEGTLPSLTWAYCGQPQRRDIHNGGAPDSCLRPALAAHPCHPLHPMNIRGKCPWQAFATLPTFKQGIWFKGPENRAGDMARPSLQWDSPNMGHCFTEPKTRADSLL